MQLPPEGTDAASQVSGAQAGHGDTCWVSSRLPLGPAVRIGDRKVRLLRIPVIGDRVVQGETHSAGDLVPRGSIAQNKYEIGGSFRGLGRLSRSSEANSDTAEKFVPWK